MLNRFFNWLYLRLPPRPAKPQCRICEVRRGTFVSADLCAECATFKAYVQELEQVIDQKGESFK